MNTYKHIIIMVLSLAFVPTVFYIMDNPNVIHIQIVNAEANNTETSLVQESVNVTTETIQEEDTTAVKDEVPESVYEKVSYYADIYGVDKNLAHYIAKNESSYRPYIKGDLTNKALCTNRKSPLYGKPAYARGVYQLTKCWYPQVSDEQAFNADFNIDYAMQIIAKGENMCTQQFTTCRNYYNK